MGPVSQLLLNTALKGLGSVVRKEKEIGEMKTRRQDLNK